MIGGDLRCIHTRRSAKRRRTAAGRRSGPRRERSGVVRERQMGSEGEAVVVMDTVEQALKDGVLVALDLSGKAMGPRRALKMVKGHRSTKAYPATVRAPSPPLLTAKMGGHYSSCVQ